MLKYERILVFGRFGYELCVWASRICKDVLPYGFVVTTKGIVSFNEVFCIDIPNLLFITCMKSS